MFLGSYYSPPPGAGIEITISRPCPVTRAASLVFLLVPLYAVQPYSWCEIVFFIERPGGGNSIFLFFERCALFRRIDVKVNDPHHQIQMTSTLTINVYFLFFFQKLCIIFVEVKDQRHRIQTTGLAIYI